VFARKIFPCFSSGYSLLIFVYEKHDDFKKKTGILQIQHTIFVDSKRTADFQTTTGILKLLDLGANSDDLAAFFEERMLPLDEIGIHELADEVLRVRPEPGYLTISNALQWRLQYSRVISEAGQVDGIFRIG